MNVLGWILYALCWGWIIGSVFRVRDSVRRKTQGELSDAIAPPVAIFFLVFLPLRGASPWATVAASMLAGGGVCGLIAFMRWQGWRFASVVAYLWPFIVALDLWRSRWREETEQVDQNTH
jgi:hypothetical protein